ncbi:MAG: hypothetical protein NTX43_13865 [Bacteroidetes bacterium]|nr:hypothetical protein [Bacteroidota bacterium]
MNPLDYKDFICWTNEIPKDDASTLFVPQIKKGSEIADELILKFLNSKKTDTTEFMQEYEKEKNREYSKIQTFHWRRLSALSPTDLITYLSVQYKCYCDKNLGRGLDFLSFIAEDLEELKSKENISVNRFKIISEWLDEQREILKEAEHVSRESKNKIKWISPPAVFCFIFRELVDKGYIAPPTWGAEWSYSGFAKQCLEHFDIGTDPDYLQKAMRDKNSLTVTKTNKFTIPNASEIA